MIEIPKEFQSIEYVTSRIPGVKDQDDLSLGANCQVFAYALLKYFSKEIPNFRSDELWADTQYTQIATTLEPLDIMMYSKNSEAYGAHVGLYAGEGFVYHLSKDNGTPKYEKHSDLLQQQKYCFFIGAKRLK